MNEHVAMKLCCILSGSLQQHPCMYLEEKEKKKRKEKKKKKKERKTTKTAPFSGGRVQRAMPDSHILCQNEAMNRTHSHVTLM